MAAQLRTPFTEMLGLTAPVALAPMGGVSGGKLAAAVSEAGGLGLLGAGRESSEWVHRELELLSSRTTRPWGVGFQSWALDRSLLQEALAYRPAAVMLSFGDPGPFVNVIKSAGAVAIVQVTDVAEAEDAVTAGADIVVAQGTEAGGHGGQRSTLPFVPFVVDLVAPRPVLAAGGIGDGRGLAAALVLGAAGAVVGSRFEATPEAILLRAETEAILAAGGDQTERSRLLDIVRGVPWPRTYTARTLRHPITEQWHGREAELAADADAIREYDRAIADGLLPAPIWAGEVIDLVTEVVPAGALVRSLVAEAHAALAGALGLWEKDRG